MPHMDTVLRAFADHFGIQPNCSPRELLGKVVTAFARLPYENITKIIKYAESGSPEKSRRYPEELINNHIDWGSGGTCFSLTSALRHLLRSLGWRAEYVLADRRYGQDTHCALLIWIDHVTHLLDPGFLILNPIPVPTAEQGIETGFNRLIVAPEGRADRISLFTVRRNSKTYRLTYKVEPADEGQFFKAWDASFDWEMMQYPLLARTVASHQIYLNGSRLQVSEAESIQSREIAPDNLIARISEEFRIQPAVVARAVAVLKNGG
jgi:arylamine N-acetyltransferase